MTTICAVKCTGDVAHVYARENDHVDVLEDAHEDDHEYDHEYDHEDAHERVRAKQLHHNDLHSRHLLVRYTGNDVMIVNGHHLVRCSHKYDYECCSYVMMLHIYYDVDFCFFHVLPMIFYHS